MHGEQSVNLLILLLWASVYCVAVALSMPSILAP